MHKLKKSKLLNVSVIMQLQISRKKINIFGRSNIVGKLYLNISYLGISNKIFILKGVIRRIKAIVTNI
jgi:hypothetical protein